MQLEKIVFLETCVIEAASEQIGYDVTEGIFQYNTSAWNNKANNDNVRLANSLSHYQFPISRLHAALSHQFAVTS